MRPTSFLVLASLAGSCGGTSPQPLYPPGTDRDEGHGLLARASARLMTSDAQEPNLFEQPQRVPRRYQEEENVYGGSAYGGDAYGAGYGGGAYGGASYATYTPPSWTYPSVNRLPTYRQKQGLTAAVEGTITWRGAVPKVASACGPIEPLHLGAGNALGGVLVYIERIHIGRMLPHANGEQRPAAVGGVVVKRGCSFAPTVQIVTPVPAQLAIHGDQTRTRLKVTLPGGGVRRNVELQEGGRAAYQLKAGTMKIEAEDGTLGAAFVIGVDTPYYALTDDQGRFRIDELSPGTYELTIWQPPVPTTSGGKLVYPAPTMVKRTVKVDAGRAARLDVSLGR